MPATQPSKQIHPLCHEHNARMEVSGRIVISNGDGTERDLFACTEPGCAVQYDESRGYCIFGQEGNLDTFPKVRCRQDGMPMYLAETNPEKRDSRLWRCPQCGGTRTNEENLVRGAPEKDLAMSRSARNDCRSQN